MKIATMLEEVPNLAREWASQRADRQLRTEADPADYDRLRKLGIHLMSVPVEFGGTWEGVEQFARPFCVL